MKKIEENTITIRRFRAKFGALYEIKGECSYTRLTTKLRNTNFFINVFQLNSFDEQ